MIVNVQDFNINMFSCYDRLPAPRGKRKEKRKYLDCICAFDIETSTDKALNLNYMYVWQFQIGDDIILVDIKEEQILRKCD